ncbi:MAG: hypothetical protein E5Y31_02390 [Mesorhizobium sp.]|nr:MAG: hypothetical protein E5Y31_02390 [Mesorhizobium sp.]
MRKLVSVSLLIWFCTGNRYPPIERSIVSRKRRTALSLCFNAIPKGKRYAFFPGKPLHTFPGIALEVAATSLLPPVHHRTELLTPRRLHPHRHQYIECGLVGHVVDQRRRTGIGQHELGFRAG